ncbi:hypothetical protein LMG27198_23740 [Methylocystis echinoides]|uniref:Uncharacterized protein n=1 Tax=Methylocystis echinoides TaxID=29468 RepID=A0A9W6LSD5_9HYPH|nr:hypothetical protein LMG27198_23740 [Methylocystis echinoides]
MLESANDRDADIQAALDDALGLRDAEGPEDEAFNDTVVGVRRFARRSAKLVASRRVLTCRYIEPRAQGHKGATMQFFARAVAEQPHMRSTQDGRSTRLSMGSGAAGGRYRKGACRRRSRSDERRVPLEGER